MQGTPPTPASASHCQRIDIHRWRSEIRPQALRLIADRAKCLPWTKRLLGLLLEELYVNDEFTELVGPSERLPPTRYAQAVAVAIALRHSWRPDDLADVANRLGIDLEPKAIEPVQPTATGKGKNNGRIGSRTAARATTKRYHPSAASPSSSRKRREVEKA